MDNRKGFSIVFFAMTTLLICCNPASSFVNQTTVQQPTFHKGWSYFFEHPIPEKVPSNKEYDVQAEENSSGKQVIKQSVIPVVDPIVRQQLPAPQCGRGGPPMPTRSLSTDIKVGGTGATITNPNNWPFLVNVRKSTDPPGVYFCSGSLISDIHVLLAAQCLERLSKCEISCLTVLLGQTNSQGILGAVTRRVERFVIHSSYNPLTFVNDIAIITMDSPVTFSRRISPVCLPPPSTDPDQHVDRDAAVMGWGPTSPGSALSLGAPSTALKHGRVTIVSLDECISWSTFFSPFVTSSNICVMSDFNNKFTCMADIGGPVVINSATAVAGSPPVWTQVGINSYTRDCASDGLKTRVSAFRAWITSFSGV